LIGVVFHVGDKNDRPNTFWNFGELGKFLGNSQAENSLKSTDGAGHAGAGFKDDVFGTGVNMGFDNLLRFVISMGHRGTRYRHLCVGVAHKRPKFFGESFFNWAIEPAGGGPVGVNDFLFTVGSLESLVRSDNVFSKRREEFF